MATRILAPAALGLVLAACSGGGDGAPAPDADVGVGVDGGGGGGGAPAAADPETASAPGPGPSFDPVSGVPAAPPAAAVEGPVTTVHMDEGELRFLEQRYRDGRKKSRRQVKRAGEGVVNHGPYTRWHPNGVVAEEGSYRDGERHGVFVERFDTGQMKVETPYVDGRIHGLKREWSDVGFVRKEAHFEDGVLHGPYATYLMLYEGVRQPHIVGQHERGEKTGEWIYHYKTGEKRDRGVFVDGRREGLWTTWFPSGELKREVEYHRDEYHGALSEYDQGVLVSRATYDMGVPHGPHVVYHPNGHEKLERTFVRGEATGPASTWYEDGQLESRGELVDGEKHGRWEFWRRDGSVDAERTGTYERGERVGP